MHGVVAVTHFGPWLADRRLFLANGFAQVAQAAVEEYRITPTMVELESWRDAQAAPTPYAVFALIYNGKLLADHQISQTRSRNIMNKLAK